MGTSQDLINLLQYHTNDNGYVSRIYGSKNQITSKCPFLDKKWQGAVALD